MVNYNNGKIYRIVPNCEHEPNEQYIGSTTKEFLSQRMAGHRKGYREWKSGRMKSQVTSFILFDKYGPDNCSICLIEAVNAKTKEELQQRERFNIESFLCINKVIPLRTKKEWNVANQENIRNQTQKYYETNYSKITEYQKQYCEANKDKFKIYHRQLYLETREENLIQQKLKRLNLPTTMCDCGGSYKAYRAKLHFDTKKHQAFICQSSL